MRHPEKKPFTFPFLLAGSMAGTVLEWYDFSIYVVLAPLMAQLFFPHEHAHQSLMMVYALFALSYAVRPLGGWFFGVLGDRFGRKHMLVVTVLMMAIPTFLVGCLPTAQAVGVWASIFLLCLRVFQGLAAGGEGTGALTLLFEMAPKNRQAMSTAMVYAGSGVGMLLGSAVAALCYRFMGSSSMLAWGWRVPFFLSVFSAGLALLLRRRLPESSVFLKARMLEGPDHVASIPLFSSSFVRLFALFAPGAVAFYVGFIFMPGFLIHSMGLPATSVYTINTVNTALLLLLCPTMGWVADRMGLRFILSKALWLLLFAAPCAYALMSLGRLDAVFWGQALLAVAVACVTGPVVAYAMKSLPVLQRYTIMACSYGVTYAILGGTAPWVASALWHAWPYAAALSVYQCFWVLLARGAVR